MADVLSRRNALLGWLVWTMAKRRLRRRLRTGGGPSGRPSAARLVTVVAVLAALAAAWARRSSGRQGTGGP